MQRVLSFQMARGEFEESSEFVTKRMCFSSVFAGGFLCILGGFLLGRFAVERTMHIRAERTKLELADNGLRINEHLQYQLLEILNAAEFESHENNAILDPASNQEFKKVFSGNEFFDQIVQTETCTIATAKGSKEPDRYVVFSASGDGIPLAIELAKAFRRIKSENNWANRRTVIICVFFGSVDFCYNELPNHVKSKIISYIAVHGNSIKENGHFTISGSVISQATLMKSIDGIKKYKLPNENLFKNHVERSQKNVLPRLEIDVPHVILSFSNKQNETVGKNENNRNLEVYQKTFLAQIIGMSIWRLSESVITLQWDPEEFSNEMNKALNIFVGDKDPIRQTLGKLVSDANNFNKKLDTSDKTNPLKVRITNDLLLDLDHALLCPDKNSRSKTDPTISSGISQIHLEEIRKCYKDANSILENQ